MRVSQIKNAAAKWQRALPEIEKSKTFMRRILIKNRGINPLKTKRALRLIELNSCYLQLKSPDTPYSPNNLIIAIQT